MENKLIDGRWKVAFTYKNGSVRLVNIYNGTKIKLVKNQYQSVVNGNTTIGKIMRGRIKSGISRNYNNHHKFEMEMSEKINYMENKRKEWVW